MMVDFHTHILPGIDDGSESAEQSIQMLRLEASQGVTDVVLTSHFYAAQNNIQQYILSRKKAYDKLMVHWNSDLPSLHLGAEVQYFEGICVADDILDLRIQGTELLLLEMPFHHWSDRVIQDLLSLNEQRNIQVLLAHIDRYLDLQDSDLWPYLVERGVLMQANASFFQGFWNRRRAVKMVQQGLIHVLGTDCHSMGSRAPYWSCVPAKVLDQLQGTSYLSTSQSLTL